MKTNFQLIYVSLCFLLLSACKEKKQSNIEAYYQETQTVRLIREAASFKIPTIFNRSSAAFLRKEVTYFQKDSLALNIVEDKLQQLQFEDSDIDIFVDTLNRDHLFTVVDMDYIPIDKETGRLFNGVITQEYKALNQSNLSIYAKRIQSSFKKGKNYSYYKSKYELTDLNEKFLPFFQTIYFLSSKNKTYGITETSARRDDIEKYLWTWTED